MANSSKVQDKAKNNVTGVTKEPKKAAENMKTNGTSKEQQREPKYTKATGASINQHQNSSSRSGSSSSGSGSSRRKRS